MEETIGAEAPHHSASLPAVPRWRRRKRKRDAGEGVPDRDARVGERRGVDQDEPDALALRGMEAVDDLALVVALEGGQREPRGLRPAGEPVVDVRERLVPVDRRLAGAEQVEVGPLEHQDRPTFGRPGTRGLGLARGGGHRTPASRKSKGGQFAAVAGELSSLDGRWRSSVPGKPRDRPAIDGGVRRGRSRFRDVGTEGAVRRRTRQRL